jgi:hypothetical protein
MRRPVGVVIGVFLVRAYQKGFAWMPPTCRYTPSCSAYTLTAIERYGLMKGSWMGLKRIARCHPYEKLGGGSGHDPVP